MSKQIKLEDAINAIEDKIAEYIPVLYGRYCEMPLEIRMAIEHLPTIEVSEDCISREDAIKAYNEAIDELVKAEMEEFNLGDFTECSFNTTQLKLIARKIENAPSVVPRLDKESLEDIKEHISESYVEGYMDGLAEGVDAIGDCNICRFAGCSECDDCINGSQWVRMTKGDEE